jgi:hypothetical protein
MDERQALKLIESGRPLRDIVREHAQDLEVHLDVGRGMIARAKLELSADEQSVVATAIVQDEKGPMKITMETSIATAEAWVREAVELNWGQKAALFLAGRGGSRKVSFARRLTTPTSKARRSYIPPELLAAHPDRVAK